MNTNQEESTALANTSPDALLQLAVSKDLDITKLEKLMELKERWQANQARIAFFDSFSLFQSKVPPLEKTKKVAFNEVKYSYAPLGEIAATIKESMREAGLSHRWEISDTEDKIICTCIISHKDGHSEKTTMSGAKDNSGKKNDIQQRGSTITYLQRYSLIAALGISTADEDNDGKDGSEKPVATKQETGKAKPTKWLNKWTGKDEKETTREWKNTIEKLMEGKVSMAVIEENYALSKVVRAELETIAQTAKPSQQSGENKEVKPELAKDKVGEEVKQVEYTDELPF